MRTEECEVIIGPAVQRVGEIFHNIQNINREPAKGESWQNSYQMYPIRFQKDLLNKEVFFNPNQTGGGGGNLPQKFSNTYSSGTESRIFLKPGC